ncbi:hypothetical protein [Shinella zoogloeoides]|uniref:hypothetical protein n=1 Tax=Shinella zoogloeoides TaxID=352475 RepID=UPI00273E6CDE|nr:hypothetical protein [Shinella zoogloeoides]WLR93265.1 hypothetical protein Q9316_03415 [Shinella zoogloeoides]
MIDTTTVLDIEADLGLTMLRARAIEGSRPHETVLDGLIIHLPWGDVEAVKVESGLRFTLSADDRDRLFLLQEVVDKRLDQAGIALDRRWSLNDLGGLPPNLAFTKVDAVYRLSPSYYRVRLGDTDLSRFFRDGLHFRLLFGPDLHPGAWPTIGSDGRIEWPGGITSWHRPVYTARVVGDILPIADFGKTIAADPILLRQARQRRCPHRAVEFLSCHRRRLCWTWLWRGLHWIFDRGHKNLLRINGHGTSIWVSFDIFQFALNARLLGIQNKWLETSSWCWRQRRLLDRLSELLSYPMSGRWRWNIGASQQRAEIARSRPEFDNQVRDGLGPNAVI